MGKCSIEKRGKTAKNPGKLREKTLNRKNSPGKSLGKGQIIWEKYWVKMFQEKLSGKTIAGKKFGEKFHG